MRWIFSTYLPHVFHVLLVILVMLMTLSSNDENLRLLTQKLTDGFLVGLGKNGKSFLVGRERE